MKNRAIIAKMLKIVIILLFVSLFSSCQNHNIVENGLENINQEENFQIDTTLNINNIEDDEPETPLTEELIESNTNSSLLSGKIVIGTTHNIYIYNYETESIVDLLESVSPSIFGVTCNSIDIWFLNTRNLFNESITAENDLPDIYYIDTDGNELQRITDNNVYKFNMEISNNSKHTLYVEDLGNIYNPEDSRYQIILSNLDNSVHKVINSSANSILGKFSPDSTQVAIVLISDDLSMSNLYIYAINSLELTILPINNEYNIKSFEWFPDQKTFLINANFDDKEMLVCLNITTGEISEIFASNYFIYEYALSPDGRKVLVSIIEYGEDSTNIIRKVLLIDIETHESIQVIEGGIDPMIGSYLPTWAPDASSFSYLQDGDNLNQKQINIVDAKSLQIVDMIEFNGLDAIYLNWIPSQ